MRLLLAVVLGIGTAGCVSRTSESSFFPLQVMEGRVEDAEVIRLPSFPRPKGVLLGLVATAPDEIKGWTVIFRFESVDEASYRLLSSRRGGLFRVTAQDGRAVFSGSSIEVDPVRWTADRVN